MPEMFATRIRKERDGHGDIHSKKFHEDIVSKEDGVFDLIRTADEMGIATPMPSLQRFYCGASVLVTGATGFMGKVLIEKLLRSCPDIDTVFMMVREKKGRSLDERIDDLVSSPCFDRIKKEMPEFRWKLRAVAGDIGSEGLGISDEDRHLLERQVNIVFHVAATVRFDEHLKLAILQNVRGTRELLGLCRTFRNLRSVVHVSTAYANCPRSQIGERFYESPFPADQAIQSAEKLDILTLDRLSHKLLGKWPNTYAFTKAVAEDVVKKHGEGLPVGVFRPSVVLCTYEEPMPGWIDNPFGPMGMMVGVHCKLLSTIRTEADSQVDMVPCDMAINALIASARDVANRSPSEEIPVYNYVSSSEKRESFRDQVKVCSKYELDWPTMRSIWFTSLNIPCRRSFLWFFQLTLHLLPAALVDGFCHLTKKRPQLLRTYRKIHKFTNVLTYFLSRKWSFEVANVATMWKSLDETDKLVFNFDGSSLSWDEFVSNSRPGVRKFILKDPLRPAERVEMERLYFLHRFTQCLFACLVGWLGLVSLSYILPSYSTQALSIK